MPNFDCSITDSELGSDAFTDDPTLLINRDYEEPNNVRSNISIRVFIADEILQLNRHYASWSYKDDWVFGGRSTASFRIENDNRKKFNLPCRLQKGLKVLVDDLTVQKRLFYGYIFGIDETEFGSPRLDGSYMTHVDVELEDSWAMMEARSYPTVYTSQRAGFILKDQAAKCGFDVSQIDENSGPVYSEFRVTKNMTPANVWERIMADLDWTYWLDIDYDPPRIIPGPKDSELSLVPLDVADTSWPKIFSELKLTPAEDDYANEVVLISPRRFSAGSANFQEGSNVVIGYSGNEQWHLIPMRDSPTIENKTTGAVYTLQKNNSNSSGVNEFVMSDEYRESTASDVPYVIRGASLPIVRRNTREIERMLAINPNDPHKGIRSKVIVRDDTAYSYDEAALICSFELSVYSRSYYRGEAKIATSWNASPLIFLVGKTLFVNCPKSKRIVAVLRIETMQRQAIGGDYRDPSGVRLEGMETTLGFTPAIYYDQEQLRAISNALRKVPDSGEEDVQDIDFIESVLAIKDCLHVVLPISEMDASIIEGLSSVRALLPPTFIAHTDRDYTCYPGYISMTGG